MSGHCRHRASHKSGHPLALEVSPAPWKRPSPSRARASSDDRYRIGSGKGFHSPNPEAGRQVALSKEEALEAIRHDHGIGLRPEQHRRNMTARGMR
ncbi:hypothetical protein [Belnapia sp. F-4-1]|uniref:hypothetical protein n=1 Tax=Belnapia sp. F-4-1 TaxID=1545443 RepID=UPI0006897F03|nr:hypothetical protein [Belnapia sp. F-4-1]